MNAIEMHSSMQRLLAQMLPSARIEVSDCQSITGGYSRVMRRVTASIDGAQRHYIVRSDPPPGAAAVETNRDHEWALVHALTQAGAPIPQALHYDAEGAALGAKTMVLEFIDGPSLLSAARNGGQDALASCANILCDMAAAAHGVDLALLPPHLVRPPDWDTYIAGCIEAWRETEAEHSESMPLFRHLAAWLERNKPAPAPLALVHGEFQPSNIMAGSAKETPIKSVRGEPVEPPATALFDNSIPCASPSTSSGRTEALSPHFPNRSAAVVDWEFAHIGDPREDLGWAKFMGATVQPPDLIGRDEAAFCRRYRERTGLDADVINPHSIAYFMILPMGRQIRLLLRSVSMFEQGTVNSLGAPYMGLGFLSSAQDVWIATTKALDAVRRAKEIAS